MALRERQSWWSPGPGLPGQVLLTATAADVDTVVGGDVIVTGGRHRLGDAGRLLALSIDKLWSAG